MSSNMQKNDNQLGDEKKTFEEKYKDLCKIASNFGQIFGTQLSRLFSYHGVESEKYIKAIPFYEKIIEYFSCIDEIIFKI